MILLLRDYQVPQASVITVCGTICCSYIVKITRTIDPWLFARDNLPRMMIQHNAVRHFYLGTTNTNFKLCLIWTKVDQFSLGFYLVENTGVRELKVPQNHKSS